SSKQVGGPQTEAQVSEPRQEERDLERPRSQAEVADRRHEGDRQEARGLCNLSSWSTALPCDPRSSHTAFPWALPLFAGGPAGAQPSEIGARPSAVVGPVDMPPCAHWSEGPLPTGILAKKPTRVATRSSRFARDSRFRITSVPPTARSAAVARR